jgi:hypothetical protein
MPTKVKTQNQRIERLEVQIFGSPRWVKIAQASQELGISCSTLRRKCESFQYREGKSWKWNYNRTERWFNIHEWRKASEAW